MYIFQLLMININGIMWRHKDIKYIFICVIHYIKTAMNDNFSQKNTQYTH